MRKKKKQKSVEKLCLLLLIVVVGSVLNAHAQNIGINATGANAHSSAALDISLSDKGILIPRIALTATNLAAPVVSPVSSLLVYNTSFSGTVPFNVTPGYYFWDGSAWKRFLTSGSDWNILGNSGTSTTINFVGTTDNQPFDIRTGNSHRIRVTQKGQLEVYNSGKSIFIGEGAGASDDLTDNQNILIGYQAGATSSYGYHNIAVGWQSLYAMIGGYRNVALGTESLKSGTFVYENTAVGYRSLFSDQNGSQNVGLGNYTHLFRQNGERNVAIGHLALGSTSMGNNNSAIGGQALNQCGGVGNTGAGMFTMWVNASGNSNTAFGAETGSTSSGNGNVLLGYRAGVSIWASHNLLYIDGNTDPVNYLNEIPLIYGNFSNGRVGIKSSVINPTNPAAALDVSGTTKLGSLGTPVTNLIQSVNNINLPGISPGLTYVLTTTVTGAATGSVVQINAANPATLGGLEINYAFVSAANTVEVVFYNPTASVVNPPAVNFYLLCAQ